MTPLDAAKALAARGFTPWEDSCHLTCEMCGADGAGEDGPFPHKTDCPWLALPQIVAALEAGERMSLTLRSIYGEVQDGVDPRETIRWDLVEQNIAAWKAAQSLATRKVAPSGDVT